jgi:hypothetical protein
MTISRAEKLEHLGWAVKSRARNQESAVKLLRLFFDHEAKWKSRKWSPAVHNLLSVSFSLWRAAFLADKTARRAEVFSDAIEFLEKIVEDNSISYLNDRNCREWTFNYYTRNARNSLEALHKQWPDKVDEYIGKKRTPTQRWSYCQDLLDSAIDRFSLEARELLGNKFGSREEDGSYQPPHDREMKRGSRRRRLRPKAN